MKKTKQNINEEALPSQITDAIKKRYEVKINYTADDEQSGRGERLIQPVTYGKSKSGNLVIRAFQPFGDTKTKTPHWKMFRIDKIDKWTPLRNRRFNEPPSEQWNADGKYNPNDKSMSEILLSANFDDTQAHYEKGGLKKYNDKRHAEKVENDPLYDFKKNIQKSTMATPEVMKRVKEWQNSKQGKMFQNAKEMSSIKDFGNKDNVSTSGPVTKNNTETNNSNTNNQVSGYDNVLKNGPVYKGNDENEIDNNENKK